MMMMELKTKHKNQEYRKSKVGAVYINKCEHCNKIFQTAKASIRFHSPDCMKAYFEEKYGTQKTS